MPKLDPKKFGLQIRVEELEQKIRRLEKLVEILSADLNAIKSIKGV